MWNIYLQPGTIEETLDLLETYGEQARVINGGTDLILEIQPGLRRPDIVIDVSRVLGLDEIKLVNGLISLGAGVTHSQVVRQAFCRNMHFPLCVPVLKWVRPKFAIEARSLVTSLQHLQPTIPSRL